jgi:hypothetical protein
MLLTKFLIFERDTGKVVQIHSQSGGAEVTSSDDLMQMLGLDRSRFDIAVVPKDSLASSGLRVVDGEVVTAGDSKLDFGGAGISDGSEVPDVEYRFQRLNLATE